jgi:hypothetical protein
MGKFYITEQEKRQILSLYEGVLTPEEINSPKGNEAKLWKEFFNLYYRMNLPLDNDWGSPEFNAAMKRYIDEKKYTAKPDSRGLYFAEVPLGWTNQKNKDLKCAQQGLYSTTLKNPSYPIYSVMYKDGKYYTVSTKQEITDPAALEQVKALNFQINPNCKS